MAQRSRFSSFSVLEVFLSLLFYSGYAVFSAAALIPFVAGSMLALLELTRRQSPFVLNTVYLVWLSVCGLAFWYVFQIPPYWIWSVHILISETARRPSEAQRKKPFLFGFKKYAAKRTREFLWTLAGGLIVAGGIYFLREAMNGVAVWMLALLAFAAAQMILDGIKEVKA